SDPEGARFHFFDAAASFLRAASLARPLVLVLDDLHAADAPSLLLLQFLAGTVADTRLLVVVAYRDVDPSLRDPLQEGLAELGRQPVTRSLRLVGLPEAEVGRFVSLTSGLAPAPHVLSSLARATEGNPLFVGEVMRLLRTEEMLESIADEVAWRRMV